MEIGKKARAFWEIFKTDINVGERKKQNNRTLQIAALVLAVICILMSCINLIQQKYIMMISTLLLMLMFLAAYFISRRTENYGVATVFGILAIIIIFTSYTVSGGNEGFATLWTVLVPMLIMSIIGVREGAGASLYFQVMYIVLFWTPLRKYMAVYYTETFMSRFPVLYFCAFAVSLCTMLMYKRQQIIMDNYQKNLEQAVLEERERVSRNTIQTIAAISKTVDAKDKYTEEHSSRVAEYSCMIAKELGWDEKRIGELRNSALLHDIGKIGIQDAILNKPERLNDEEYQVMKTHTDIGGRILKELTFLKNGSEGAKYHHERYDGNGYPKGLKGEEIPEAARIICMADAFDAMNSNRIYRKKCSGAYIVEEIKKGSGRQFDPVIADAFLRCIEKEKLLTEEVGEASAGKME